MEKSFACSIFGHLISVRATRRGWQRTLYDLILLLRNSNIFSLKFDPWIASIYSCFVQSTFNVRAAAKFNFRCVCGGGIFSVKSCIRHWMLLASHATSVRLYKKPPTVAPVIVFLETAIRYYILSTYHLRRTVWPYDSCVGMTIRILSISRGFSMMHLITEHMHCFIWLGRR